MASSELEWDILAHREAHPEPETQGSVAKDLISGTVGGIAQVLAGQPFDTTKVRLQSAPPGKYKGAMDVVKRLISEEGPSAFYKGTLTPLVGIGACVSVQFAVNEASKRHFAKSNKLAGHANPNLLSYSQLYVCGASAGLANSFLASPIEQVRIRLQTQVGNEFRGPLDVARKVWAAQGLKGIYRGLWPTVLRESHGMAMYFLVAEALTKHHIAQNNIQRKDVATWRVCTYGGCAGLGMWLCVYPIDVLKSKMQTDALSAERQKYPTLRVCLRETLREGGVRALFSGFMPTILRAFPVNAATFVAFEMTLRALG